MSEIKTSGVGGERSVFLEGLLTATGLVTVWFFWGLALALPPLALAMGWMDWLSDATAHRYEPGRLVPNLDEIFRHDHGQGLETLRTGTRSALAVLGIVYALLGVFRAGGWLQVLLERNQARPLRRFFFGGGRYFFRFLRIAFMVVVLLAAVSWALGDLPWTRLVDERLLGLASGELEDLDSERTVVWRAWGQALAGFLAFSLVMAWALFARTRMALLDGSSAFAAGFMTVLLFLRHPLRTLRPLIGIFLVEALLLALLTVCVRLTNGAIDTESSWIPVAGLFLLSMTALFWREVTRGARYAAALRVSAELLRKPQRPDDPKSLGGPGGPRYPLDTEEDEYGVSL